MEDESVPVTREGEWHVERLGVVQRLLHSFAGTVVVVLGFNDSDGAIGAVIEDEVSAAGLPPRVQLPADNDAALRERHFLTNLSLNVPP